MSTNCLSFRNRKTIRKLLNDLGYIQELQNICLEDIEDFVSEFVEDEDLSDALRSLIGKQKDKMTREISKIQKYAEELRAVSVKSTSASPPPTAF